MKKYAEDDLVNWNIVTPESVGIPSESVLGFIDELEQEDLCMHGFILLKGGKVFAEGYYAPFDADFPHRMYSVGKSFTSVAIGILQEEGKLSLDDRICDYFPDKLPPEGVHPYIRETTIKDMLCMASPHKFTTYKQMSCEDWVRTFFAVHPVRYPGTSFAYDTSSTHVLSALVERLSGMSLLDYLRCSLLNELGCSENIKWLTCPLGICQGGSGLICTLRDVAKVAYTCMHNGRFRGKQLIPEKFITEATAKQIDTCLQPAVEERQGYGYQFWRCRNNGFALYGIGGQLAICLPDHDFILATEGDTTANPNGVQAIYQALWHQLLPFLHGKENKPLMEAPVMAERLRDKITRLAVKPEKDLSLVHFPSS